MSTTQVASYSILAIPLLVVCLTLVRWPTIVTANLSINLTAKRITPRCGKKKKTRGKKKNLTAKFLRYLEDILILISFAVRSWLFVLPWGYSFCCDVFLFAVRLFFWPWGYSFCCEVFLFAIRLILLPWQLWATVPLKFCSRRFLIFQHVGIHEN